MSQSAYDEYDECGPRSRRIYHLHAPILLPPPVVESLAHGKPVLARHAERDHIASLKIVASHINAARARICARSSGRTPTNTMANNRAGRSELLQATLDMLIL